MDKNYYYAYFFLLVQIIAIIRNLLEGYNYYFWFCDFAPILFSIAFFIKNKNLVKGLINFGLIPQIIFLIDFVYLTSTGISPLGITFHLLKFNSFAIFSTILVHLTTFFALLFTFRIKPNKWTLFDSIIFMLAVYVIMLTLTSPEGDVNYVYSTGNLLSSFNFTIPHIVWLWPFLTFLIIILPTHGIQYLIYKFFKKHKKSMR